MKLCAEWASSRHENEIADFVCLTFFLQGTPAGVSLEPPAGGITCSNMWASLNGIWPNKSDFHGWVFLSVISKWASMMSVTVGYPGRNDSLSAVSPLKVCPLSPHGGACGFLKRSSSQFWVQRNSFFLNTQFSRKGIDSVRIALLFDVTSQRGDM